MLETPNSHKLLLSLLSLPHADYVVDESGEVDESGMAERPGTINESEIVESEKSHFGESEVKTTMAKKNIVATLSMLIFVVIPMTMLM